MNPAVSGSRHSDPQSSSPCCLLNGNDAKARPKEAAPESEFPRRPHLISGESSKDDTNSAEPTMTRHRWSYAEIATVLTRYPIEGPSSLAVELGRSEYSVHGLARRFGLRTPRKPYRRRTRTRAPSCQPNPNGDSGTTSASLGYSASWNSSAVGDSGTRKR